MWDIEDCFVIYSKCQCFFFPTIFSNKLSTFLCNSREWTCFCVKAIEPNGLAFWYPFSFFSLLLKIFACVFVMYKIIKW